MTTMEPPTAATMLGTATVGASHFRGDRLAILAW